MKLKRNELQKITVHQDSSTIYGVSNQGMNIISLHSSDTVGLKVFLVHGHDFIRESIRTFNGLMFFESKLMQILILLFFLKVILLFIMRSIYSTGDKTFISAFIDVYIAFVCGGNLKYHFKWEKVFFISTLFGSFFMQSMGIYTNLLQTFLFVDHSGVDTYAKLAKLNSTIYLGFSLEGNLENVKQMIE